LKFERNGGATAPSFRCNRRIVNEKLDKVMWTLTMSIKRLASIALVPALLIAALGCGAGNQASATIVVDGSTTVFPLSEAVAEHHDLAFIVSIMATASNVASPANSFP
jgi:hypothetical protein